MSLLASRCRSASSLKKVCSRPKSRPRNSRTVNTEPMNILTSAPAPVLELRGISKAFPGVQALSGVALNLYPGEVHTLMGQNGAGKSTLIKVLTGVYAPDQGQIVLEGQAIHPGSTLDAQNLGISTVYQEVNLCPNLSVAENIFIGRYPTN